MFTAEDILVPVPAKTGKGHVKASDMSRIANFLCFIIIPIPPLLADGTNSNESNNDQTNYTVITKLAAMLKLLFACSKIV